MRLWYVLIVSFIIGWGITCLSPLLRGSSLCCVSSTYIYRLTPSAHRGYRYHSFDHTSSLSLPVGWKSQSSRTYGLISILLRSISGGSSNGDEDYWRRYRPCWSDPNHLRASSLDEEHCSYVSTTRSNCSNSSSLSSVAASRGNPSPSAVHSKQY